MNITTKKDNDGITVALSGRFTFSDHTPFRDVLINQVELVGRNEKVTFDLSAVDFVDSAALGMLLLAREAAQRQMGSIVLRGATGQVQRMLEVSRFGLLFTMVS
jgi:anti-anti-sigma factor